MSPRYAEIRRRRFVPRGRERLSRNGVPLVFYTGEARPEILLKWPTAPVPTKLVDKKRMVDVVAGVLP